MNNHDHQGMRIYPMQQGATCALVIAGVAVKEGVEAAEANGARPGLGSQLREVGSDRRPSGGPGRTARNRPADCAT
jgi:hypothetical protein